MCSGLIILYCCQLVNKNSADVWDSSTIAEFFIMRNDFRNKKATLKSQHLRALKPI